MHRQGHRATAHVGRQHHELGEQGTGRTRRRAGAPRSRWRCTRDWRYNGNQGSETSRGAPHPPTTAVRRLDPTTSLRTLGRRSACRDEVPGRSDDAADQRPSDLRERLSARTGGGVWIDPGDGQREGQRDGQRPRRLPPRAHRYRGAAADTSCTCAEERPHRPSAGPQPGLNRTPRLRGGTPRCGRQRRRGTLAQHV